MFNDQCFEKKLRNEMIKKIQRIFFFFLKFFKKFYLFYQNVFFLIFKISTIVNQLTI